MNYRNLRAVMSGFSSNIFHSKVYIFHNLSSEDFEFGLNGDRMCNYTVEGDRAVLGPGDLIFIEASRLDDYFKLIPDNLLDKVFISSFFDAFDNEEILGSIDTIVSFMNNHFFNSRIDGGFAGDVRRAILQSLVYVDANSDPDIGPKILAKVKYCNKRSKSFWVGKHDSMMYYWCDAEFVDNKLSILSKEQSRYNDASWIKQLFHVSLVIKRRLGFIMDKLL